MCVRILYLKMNQGRLHMWYVRYLTGNGTTTLQGKTGVFYGNRYLKVVTWQMQSLHARYVKPHGFTKIILLHQQNSS